jgi:hypothetical protein
LSLFGDKTSHNTRGVQGWRVTERTVVETEGPKGDGQ